MEPASVGKKIWFVLGCLALIMIFFQFILGGLAQFAMEKLGFHPNEGNISFAILCAREPCIAIFAFLAIGKGFHWKVAFRGISFFHFLLVIALVPPVFIVLVKTHDLSRAALDQLKSEPHQEVASKSQPNEGQDAIGKIEQSYAVRIQNKPWWTVFLVGAAFPAIAEEICYRGLVGRLALARFGALWGVTLSSAFFGAMHMNLESFPYVAVLGLITHILFLFTKTIFAPVLLHSLHNASSFTLSKLQIETKFLPLMPNGDVPVSVLLVAAAVIAVISLLLLCYQTQVAWAMPDGHIWTPGYPSGEMPPPESNAHPIFRFPSAAFVPAAFLYLAFLGIFAVNVSTWVALNDYWQLLAKVVAKTTDGDYEGAIGDCDKAVQIMPDCANAYLARGLVWESQKELDKAIADYTEAIRVEPKNVFAYNNRGWVWYLRKDLCRAIADYTDAIRLDSKCGRAYGNRGFAYSRNKNYDKALADYNEAIRLDPNDGGTLNNRAWLWATCPDAKYRNGKSAIASAKQALALDPKDAIRMETLATAIAEIGDFQEAVRWQEKALAGPQLWNDAAARRRLGFYRENKPYRQE